MSGGGRRRYPVTSISRYTERDSVEAVHNRSAPQAQNAAHSHQERAAASPHAPAGVSHEPGVTVLLFLQLKNTTPVETAQKFFLRKCSAFQEFSFLAEEDLAGAAPATLDEALLALAGHRLKPGDFVRFGDFFRAEASHFCAVQELSSVVFSALATWVGPQRVCRLGSSLSPFPAHSDRDITDKYSCQRHYCRPWLLRLPDKMRVPPQFGDDAAAILRLAHDCAGSLSATGAPSRTFTPEDARSQLRFLLIEDRLWVHREQLDLPDASDFLAFRRQAPGLFLAPVEERVSVVSTEPTAASAAAAGAAAAAVAPSFSQDPVGEVSRQIFSPQASTSVRAVREDVEMVLAPPPTETLIGGGFRCEPRLDVERPPVYERYEKFNSDFRPYPSRCHTVAPGHFQPLVKSVDKPKVPWRTLADVERADVQDRALFNIFNRSFQDRALELLSGLSNAQLEHFLESKKSSSLALILLARGRAMAIATRKDVSWTGELLPQKSDEKGGDIEKLRDSLVLHDTQVCTCRLPPPSNPGARLTDFVRVEDTSTQAAVRAMALKHPQRRDQIAWLNMANAHHVGGGFQFMKGTQEEGVGGYTSLFGTLIRVARYGSGHTQDRLVYDAECHIPPGGNYFCGCVFPGTKSEGEIWVNCITHAFADFRRPDGRFRRENDSRMEGEDYDTRSERQRLLLDIHGVLRTAVLHGQRYLILGAAGCGAFQHDPRVDAGMWKEALLSKEFRGHFDDVVFAVLGHQNFRAFQRALA